MRLHIDLMHLLALLSAVLVGALEARRFHLAPRRHAAADLSRNRVVSIAGRCNFGDSCASGEDGQSSERYSWFHELSCFFELCGEGQFSATLQWIGPRMGYSVLSPLGILQKSKLLRGFSAAMLDPDCARGKRDAA